MVASLLFWTCLITVPMISLGYWALVILILSEDSTRADRVLGNQIFEAVIALEFLCLMVLDWNAYSKDLRDEQTHGQRRLLTLVTWSVLPWLILGTFAWLVLQYNLKLNILAKARPDVRHGFGVMVLLLCYLLASCPRYMQSLWSGPRRKRVQVKETPEP